LIIQFFHVPDQRLGERHTRRSHEAYDLRCSRCCGYWSYETSL
jgi:hypothetical protein